MNFPFSAPFLTFSLCHMCCPACRRRQRTGSMFLSCLMAVHMMCMGTAAAAAMSAAATASTAAAAVSASTAAAAVFYYACALPVDHQTAVAKYKEQYNYICYHKIPFFLNGNMKQWISAIFILPQSCSFKKGTGCFHPAPLLCRFNIPTLVFLLRSL